MLVVFVTVKVLIMLKDIVIVMDKHMMNVVFVEAQVFKPHIVTVMEII
jgi:hypothetical protein